MVSVVASCLKKQHPLFLSLLFLATTCVQANIWDDIKSAANKVGDAFVTAGKEIEKAGSTAIGAIKERFSNTKTTRALDYGIRKAAFEAALATANGILEGSKQASTGTLIAAEETAKAGLTVAEKFLSDVVAAASPQILQASATTAKGVLEGVKQAGVGTLKGTQWIISQATSTLDINRIRYQGDLQRLKTGVLGDMLCEGVIFKKPFSFTFDLDPRDIKSVEKSVLKLVKEFERLFNENVANPIKNAFVPLKQQVQKSEKLLATLPTADPRITQGIEAAKKASAIAANLITQDAKAIQLLEEATKKLNELAQKNNKELEELIQKGIAQKRSIQNTEYQGYIDVTDSILARQELVRRLKNKATT